MPVVKTISPVDPNKLPAKDIATCIRLYGEGKKPQQINDHIFNTTGKNIDIQKLANMLLRKDYQVFIERARDKYLSEVKLVAIANKRIRLDDLQVMRDKLFDMTVSLDATLKEDREEILDIYRRINEVLAIAREEMEGKSHTFQQINITEVSSWTDEELQRRKAVLIAKATGTYNERDFGIGEDSEGGAAETDAPPPEIPLATPEKL